MTSPRNSDVSELKPHERALETNKLKVEMIMTRTLALVIAALAVTAGAAVAGNNVSDKSVKDAIRYNQIVSTGGLWDAR